ncbi:NAD(P)-dependent oxidoreductase [Mycobacterium sp. CBMA271]|uniref:NAD(P)-dependent oxidoreductase n=1 Tax=unclassified Mycobacteroides TaxID=2618759 RepID=UPI0012DFCAC8|nr:MULTISPECIES: NAD(P)-dependent oxidoreductase [unclassified Mycobacteroides]MUM18042.1 3-hydroxyisobutyrate dehydrogenase [Mycobacteroides sp. CBMA 326]MUM23478.1 NAD(P)-dependent oxidoreductase [Mycobacteroides sp. CBMA 271]
MTTATTLRIDAKPELSGRTVGLVGAGRMGTGIGRCLLGQGAELRVMANKDRSGVNELVEHGASESHSLSQLADGCAVVVLSLPSSAQVEAVCRQGGLLAGLAPKTIVLDTTTAWPHSTIELAAQAAALGIRFVDAPVTRSPEQARRGALNSMLGCDDNFQEFIDVVAAYSATIMRVGPTGSAHKMKIVYNAMTMGISAVASEACQLASSMDVDLRALRGIVSMGSTNSGIFQKITEYLLEEDADALSISLENAAKDIRLAVDAAAERGVNLRSLSAASETFREACDAGYADQTLPNLATHSQKNGS